MSMDDERLDDIHLIQNAETDLRDTSLFQAWTEGSTSENGKIVSDWHDDLTDRNVDVLVVDCFSDAFLSGDANDNDDVTKFYRGILHMCQIKANVETILFLHHAHKSGAGGLMNARGCTAITSKPRTALSITHNKETGLNRLTCEKPRGYADQPLHFVFQNYNVMGEPCDIRDPDAEAIKLEIADPSDFEEDIVTGECKRDESLQTRKEKEKALKIRIAKDFIRSKLATVDQIPQCDLTEQAKIDDAFGSRSIFKAALEDLKKTEGLTVIKGEKQQNWVKMT